MGFRVMLTNVNTQERNLGVISDSELKFDRLMLWLKVAFFQYRGVLLN